MLEKKALSVGAGLLVGLVGGKVLNSKLAKKATVNTVVGGLKVKESIDKTIESIRVSAEDVLAEAKEVKAKEEAEEAKKEAEQDIEKVACECECGCEEETSEEENK
ncbi:MAG: DUF6110 family protein [Anaerococcus prevotii]|uniref:DUF6110 family protein n=1 Tax=Anaerococcus prevotii TaxID=33034 RepID=UPI002901A484|nr:DUF6110 family protein [Anaerococcus prevotii]MDU2557898.1 DUF6110 family protein [Anaerococcus prevotii]MDU3136000.1 DUF6110 family protein [Anaerococcus prevotii]